MSLIRKFDIFQKISVDNITQPTLVGSVLSLSAIGLMLFLLVKEFLSFMTPLIKKESTVLHDKDQTTKIDVNLGIKFPNVPCHLISVDQEDSVGNHRMDIKDTIIKTRVNKNGHLISEPLVGYIHTDKLIEALMKEEGCFVSGFIPVTKVSGDIHISFHNYADLFNFIRFERSDLFEKISLNHRITDLSFGQVGSNDEILKIFNLDLNSNPTSAFNNPNNLPNFIGETRRKNYDYYVKLIPHIFDDKINDDQPKKGYQYSMTSRIRDFNPDGNEMPIVIIHYDFSPITMRFTLESRSLLKTLTHICAIIGGIFVIFKILNGILISLFYSGKSS